MNRSSLSRLVLGLALPVLLALSFAPTASAKVPVNVRAVTWQGKILFDRTVRTGTTTVPSSSKATCFGGSPTDGSRKIPGATALGALQDAQAAKKPHRPLSLTNIFDFGLGICGVGSAVARGEQWWELTHNHKPSTLGGEGTKLKRGDTVLWYLSKTYNEPSPDELFLKAPKKVRKDTNFQVRVLAFNNRGKARPVEGARLSVPGTALTDARGYTRLKVKRKTQFAARIAGLIPSNRAVVRIRR